MFNLHSLKKWFIPQSIYSVQSSDQKTAGVIFLIIPEIKLRILAGRGSLLIVHGYTLA